MKFLLFILRFALGIALLGFCLASFAAFLGFVSPILDALNHLQPILFFGTLSLWLLVALVFIGHSWRAGMLALGASGFLASAVIVIPEQVSGFFVQPGPVKTQQVIKLMSHNLFGLNTDMRRMANVIAAQAPDIITFQEYFNEQRAGLHPLIIDDYPYFATCAGRKRSHVAIYSKMPFEIGAGTQCAADAEHDNNPVARLVAGFVDKDGVAFNVVTTHLNWPVQVHPLFDSSLSFGEKLTAIPLRKQLEWAALTDAIKGLDGPVILAGDFNSTSWSYAMGQFTRETALIRHSHGLLTYPKLFYIKGWRELPAFLPIDHLMANQKVQVQSVWRGQATGSDHLPIYGEFLIKGAE